MLQDQTLFYLTSLYLELYALLMFTFRIIIIIFVDWITREKFFQQLQPNYLIRLGAR